MVIRDLDGDGHPDLAITNEEDATLSVLLNQGKGTFATVVNYPTELHPRSLVAADFNGDRLTDLAVACIGLYESGKWVSVYLNQGHGVLAARVNYEVDVTPGDLATGDLNGDGIVDLVSATFGNAGPDNTLSLLLGRGDGTFKPKLDDPIGFEADRIAVADLNGDGLYDVTTVSAGDDRLSEILLCR